MSRLSVATAIRSPAVVIGGFTLLTFPILEMLLFRQRATQYAHDVFDGDLPGLVALRDDWLRFGPSLWDAHLTSGNASFAQFAVPPTTPDFALSFVIPMFWAYAITYGALIWVAGYGMARFLRESIGVGPGPALLGGSLYAVSFWHYIHYFAIPLLPLSLWMLDRWADAGERRRWTVALVFLVAFGLYAGLLQLQIIIAAVQGAYLLVTRWASADRVRTLARFVGVWVTGVLLYAPVLITQLVALSASHRVVWDPDYLYDADPLAALGSTISLFGATVTGIPIPEITSGSTGYSGTYFLGGIALPLLVFGISAHQRSLRTRFLVALLASIPALYYVALIATPVQTRIPLLGSFQFIRISHVFPFALAAVAAIGADELVLRRPPRVRGTVARLTLGVVITWLIVQCVIAAAQFLGNGKPAWMLALVALAGGTTAGVAMTLSAARRSQLPAAFLLVLLVALGGERLLFARAERGLHPGLGTFAAQMLPDRAMRFIADQPNDGMHRTLTAGTPSNRMVLTGALEAGGYQSLYPLRYHLLFGGLTDPYLRTDPSIYRYFHDWGNRASVFGSPVDPELLDLMGVRWLYARGMTFEDESLRSPLSSGRVTVYENTDPFPRAFLVHGVRSYRSLDAVLAGMTAASRSELRDIVHVVDDGGIVALSPPAATASPDIVRIVRYTPDAVTVMASSTSGGVLVLTDTFAPGWTVSVNGDTTTIVPVDLAYRGVTIPPGDVTVEFQYRPVFTYVGFMVAFFTALGLGIWGLVSPSRRRWLAAR